MTTMFHRLAFPNDGLLFDLEQLYRGLQTVPVGCLRSRG